MNKDSKKNQSGAACPKTLCLLIVCATIAFLAYLHVCCPKSGVGRRLWMPVIVEGDGKETVLGETRQMEFWTPSAKTKDYLHKDGAEVTAKEQWEAIPDDNAVADFGSVLHSNKFVLGYRRVEVWGQGRTTYKPGWWWTVGVLTNCSVGDMAKTYQGFWKNQQPVYVEVIDNRGSDEP